MQFPDCHGWQRRRWRPPLAALLMLALTSFAAAAHAADFDEKLKAPTMGDADELRSQARGYSARFNQQRAALTPEQLVRDAALQREHFDLSWKIQRAIDEGRPLPDLAEVGMVATADGGVAFDGRIFPQWMPLHERISTLVPGWDMTVFGPELVRRGFRPSDVTLLQNYVATHDVQRFVAQRALPVAMAFNKVVAKRDRLKQTVDYGLAMSFFYQQARAKYEASREWTAGLFDVLDAHRTRILAEIIFGYEAQTSWTASDPSEAVADMLTLMRRPDFQQRASAEAQGVQP